MQIIHTDTNVTQSGNTDTVFLFFSVCWLQENWFCHLTLCFVATQCLQNSPLTHTCHRYSHGKGLACMGGSSFRAWEAALFLCVSYLYSHWPIWCVTCVLSWCHASWFWLGPHPNPSPQVALLLSVSRCHAAASPTSLCVCVRSALGRFLFAAHMLLPTRVCPLVRWTLEAVSCKLCPCQRILNWLFSASEGGQTSSLFCSLPRTTLTSSSGPVGSWDLKTHSSFTLEISKTCPPELQSSKFWSCEFLKILGSHGGVSLRGRRELYQSCQANRL